MRASTSTGSSRCWISPGVHNIEQHFPACILKELLHLLAAPDRPTGAETVILKLTDSLRLLETERDEAVGTGEVLTWQQVTPSSSGTAAVTLSSVSFTQLSQLRSRSSSVCLAMYACMPDAALQATSKDAHLQGTAKHAATASPSLLSHLTHTSCAVARPAAAAAARAAVLH
jgi:hypothetical protein